MDEARGIRPVDAVVRMGDPMGNGRSIGVDHTARYEIRVRGRLSTTTLAAFSGLHSELRPVETVLVGDLRDQAELYGVLGALQDLGIELIEVRQLPDVRS